MDFKETLTPFPLKVLDLLFVLSYIYSYMWNNAWSLENMIVIVTERNKNPQKLLQEPT